MRLVHACGFISDFVFFCLSFSLLFWAERVSLFRPLSRSGVTTYRLSSTLNLKILCFLPLLVRDITFFRDNFPFEYSLKIFLSFILWILPLFSHFHLCTFPEKPTVQCTIHLDSNAVFVNTHALESGWCFATRHILRNEKTYLSQLSRLGLVSKGSGHV